MRCRLACQYLTVFSTLTALLHRTWSAIQNLIIVRISRVAAELQMSREIVTDVTVYGEKPFANG